MREKMREKQRRKLMQVKELDKICLPNDNQPCRHDRTISWLDLPVEIFQVIARYLPLQDYLQLGLVCQVCSSIVREQRNLVLSKLPWLVLCDDPATKLRGFYSLSEQKLYQFDIPVLHGRRCGSSHGWLITIDDPLHIRMVNPFLGVSMIQLPPLPSPHLHTGSVFPLHKIVLSADPSKCSDYVAMAIYHKTRKLAFWSPECKEWTCVPGDAYHDVIWFRGQIYAARDSNTVVRVNVAAGPCPEVVINASRTGIHGPYSSYLVDMKGELVLAWKSWGTLNMQPRWTGRLMVQLWSQPHTCPRVGDHAFFLGTNGSVAVSSSELPGIRGDSIYFTDDRDTWTLAPDGEWGFREWVGNYEPAKLGGFGQRAEPWKPCFTDPGLFPPTWLIPSPQSRNDQRSRH